MGANKIREQVAHQKLTPSKADMENETLSPKERQGIWNALNSQDIARGILEIVRDLKVPLFVGENKYSPQEAMLEIGCRSETGLIIARDILRRAINSLHRGHPC